MCSEFLRELTFQFLGGIRPAERLGLLVVKGDERVESSFEFCGGNEMVGLQTLALKDAEPDFNLIEPGRVGR